MCSLLPPCQHVHISVATQNKHLILCFS